MKTKHAGADWIEDARPYWKSQRTDPMSEFGKKVADLLGQVYGGIYHLDSKALSKVDWSDPDRIELVFHDGRGLATYDSSDLTNMVLLCHMMDVRLDIEAATCHYLRLVFMPVTRRGFFRVGHPYLDEAIRRAQRLLLA